MNLENLANNIRLLCVFNKKKYVEVSLAIFADDYRLYDIMRIKGLVITDNEIEAIAKYFNISPDELVNKKAFLEFK